MRHAEKTQSSSNLSVGDIPISRTCLKVGQQGRETIVVGRKARVSVALEAVEYKARMLSMEASSMNLA